MTSLLETLFLIFSLPPVVKMMLCHYDKINIKRNQNIAEQKTEMEIDLRDDYDPAETALAFGISGAAPVALAPGPLNRPRPFY